MSDLACVFCKHHSWYLSEEMQDGINVIGVEGCHCKIGHEAEHSCFCSAFDPQTCDSCEFFEEGDGE